MSTTASEADALRVEPRDRVSVSTQITQLSDFDGDVFVSAPLAGAHLQSIALARLFLAALAIGAGLGCGLTLAIGVVTIGRDIGRAAGLFGGL